MTDTQALDAVIAIVKRFFGFRERCPRCGLFDYEADGMDCCDFSRRALAQQESGAEK